MRLIYTKSLFFLSQEEKIIKSLKTAFNLCILYIHHLNTKLKDSMHQIHKTLNSVLIRIDCYYNLHNNSKTNFQSGDFDIYKGYLLQFQQLVGDLEKCVHSANELIKKVDVLYKRQVILDKVLPNVTPIIQNCDITNE